MKNSYQHSHLGEPLRVYEVPLEARERRRLGRRKSWPQVWVWAVGAFLVFKVVCLAVVPSSLTDKTLGDTEQPNYMSMRMELFGSQHHHISNKNHDTKEKKKKDKEKENKKEKNRAENKSGKRGSVSTLSPTALPTAQGSHVDRSDDETTPRGTNGTKHHHKHVDVHVVVDDDDYTIFPYGTNASSAGDSQQAKSDYDWQKCTKSKDPESCWKNAYISKIAPSPKTITPSLSPTVKVAPTRLDTIQKGTMQTHTQAQESQTDDDNKKAKTFDYDGKPTQVPSAIDWKEYGNELHAKMQVCIHSNEPDCWKNMFSPLPTTKPNAIDPTMSRIRS